MPRPARLLNISSRRLTGGLVLLSPRLVVDLTFCLVLRGPVFLV